MEAGAGVEHGRYKTRLHGGDSLYAERGHRERCSGTNLCGLEIEFGDAQAVDYRKPKGGRNVN
jgi:hypothetical protein